jgi:hypothetical protein
MAIAKWIHYNFRHISHYKQELQTALIECDRGLRKMRSHFGKKKTAEAIAFKLIYLKNTRKILSLMGCTD